MKNPTIIADKSFKYEESYATSPDVTQFTCNMEIDLESFDAQAMLQKVVDSHAFAYFKYKAPEMTEDNQFADVDAFLAYMDAKTHGTRIDKATKERAAEAVKQAMQERQVKTSVINSAVSQVKNATLMNVQLLKLKQPALAEGIGKYLEALGQVEMSALWQAGLTTEIATSDELDASDLGFE